MIGWLRQTHVLLWLLAASLAANLFLGGLLAGRSAGRAVADSHTRRSIQAMLAPLPDAQRELVRRELAVAMPQVRAHFADLQAARARLAEQMLLPEPDPAALERAFAQVQTHTSAIGVALQQAMARALPRLSLADRRAMVQALAQRQTGGALPLP